MLGHTGDSSGANGHSCARSRWGTVYGATLTKGPSAASNDGALSRPQTTSSHWPAGQASPMRSPCGYEVKEPALGDCPTTSGSCKHSSLPLLRSWFLPCVKFRRPSISQPVPPSRFSAPTAVIWVGRCLVPNPKKVSISCLQAHSSSPIALTDNLKVAVPTDKLLRVLI